MSTTDRTKLIEKLRKLKTKAEDAGCTEQEAMTFAGKLSDMMREHMVSMAEVEAAEEAERLAREEGMKYMDAWRRSILGSVALTCGCYVLFDTRNKSVELFGRPLNVEAMWEMYQFIEKQIVQISRDMYPGQQKYSRQAQKGLGIGVCGKLREHRDQDQANPANLPVVQEQEASQGFAEDEMGKRGMRITTMKRRSMRDSVALQEGIRNAGRVQLRQEVG